MMNLLHLNNKNKKQVTDHYYLIAYYVIIIVLLLVMIVEVDWRCIVIYDVLFMMISNDALECHADNDD